MSIIEDGAGKRVNRQFPLHLIRRHRRPISCNLAALSLAGEVRAQSSAAFMDADVHRQDEL